ncbi:MAG TPA: ABC transporter permease [Burkholderiales bacterium]|jgi:putative ABC transport system permease protein|nr:ABC transporter permease [Burkholderiales bacterium]
MAEFFAAFWNLLPVSLGHGLLHAFVALGIMIPFRLLNFPDLTSEGAFPLGGCVCAALIAAAVHPLAAMLVALVAGFGAGCVTAGIHLRLRINTLLAGILVVTMLWSVNLRVMGKSNIPLFSLPNAFDQAWSGFTASHGAQITFWVALSAALVLAARWFLRTEAGLVVRAVGANDTMARANGVNVARVTLLGVGTANAFSAFAGASLAQIQGYADVAMGFGMLINGLAALIIGEAITGRDSVLRQILAPFVGALVYYLVVALGLAAGVHPSDLKLVTGLFVLGTLGLPAFRRAMVREPRLRA